MHAVKEVSGGVLDNPEEQTALKGSQYPDWHSESYAQKDPSALPAALGFAPAAIVGFIKELYPCNARLV